MHRVQQVAKGDIGSLGASGLKRGGLGRSRRRKFAERERDTHHPNQGETQQDAPDSHDPKCCAVCFHVASLILCRARVLIERFVQFIERSDEGRGRPCCVLRVCHRRAGFLQCGFKSVTY